LPANNLTNGDLQRIYRSLRLIRRAEEEVARIYPTDVIKSPVHLSIGQEAVAVGVAEALNDDDVAAGSYRGHATYLAKGASLPAFMAELFGKSTGCAGGRGGSMHLIGPDKNVLGTSAVVATHMSPAVGYALALAHEGKGRVAAIFFGDGSTEEGVFYECLNFAALHQLPVLFVCENNDYAIHTPISKRWATRRLCERVETYGIPAQQVLDSDVFRIRELSQEAVARMRRGGGPAFLECFTYRWREHVGPAEDFASGYRRTEDMAAWVANDQMERVGRLLNAEVRAEIDASVEQEIAAAIKFAEDSPFPLAEELHTGVFAP
jgi:TPP-dependent pyruvate/acetoin dehydrogenase alpha subunit